jgi:dipeptidyl aminopeptidase/acylaminoacyl peptidase
MKTIFRSGALALAVMALCLSAGPAQSQDAPKPVTWQDVAAWKSISPFSVTLSDNGQWLAYWHSPNKGNSQLVLQHTSDTIRKTWDIGDASGNARAAIRFNADSRYLAFTEFPTEEAKEKASRDNPPQNKLRLVKLDGMEETSFENVRDFSFSGESPDWLAVHLSTPKPATGKDAPRGTDLLLYNLAEKSQFNFGNVASYAFNKNGKWLAWVIDATGKAGNGVFLRNMSSGQVLAPESDKARYTSLSWSEEGDALAVLKAIEDEGYEDPLHQVIGFRNLDRNLVKTTFDPAGREDFPEGMTVSPNRRPGWSDDLGSLFFGVHKAEKKEDPRAEKEAAGESKEGEDGEGEDGEGEGSGKGADSPADTTQTAGKTPPKNEEEKPDLVLWHWQDSRLQSVQQNREQMDKNFSHASVYHLADDRFVQLADDNIRAVMVNPKSRYAIGYDTGPYELDAGLSGQSRRDVWVIDMLSGDRHMLLEGHVARGAMDLSPDGTMLAYYQEGDYLVHHLESGETLNLTRELPTSFVNKLSDVNVEYPPTPYFGWTSDSRFLLLRDNQDLWKVAANGRRADNLTADGTAPHRIYQMRYSLDPEEKGVDLSQPMYLRFIDDDTKATGIARIDNGRPGPRVLLHGDYVFGQLGKARHAQTYLFTRESVTEAPDYHISFSHDLGGARKLTDMYPEAEGFALSPGSRLLSFVSDKGDTLQAALFLPAGYEEGKSYPTVVYIYERLTQGLNGYARPSFPGGGFNRAMYTSNGYAVLMPDIVYRLNDPGMSAVWCVLPAVDAAIATGIVDGENVAIHGHSWGGYQTSFLITQTDKFKAAVAGAPLTNMISMYSLIYWNTGGTNQAIFESSQGRFTSGYWDNWEAYKRNSPVYFAAQVSTPLLLMHNDKDGAVDFTQGVEYYNTLRRLRKPVVMLQYKGENHGLRKLPNQIDYALRMMEFLDHHLKGAEAPAWLQEGIPLLEMEKHLEQRPAVLKP